MVKGIIFDMDGVLADTEYFYQVRRNDFLREVGFVRHENHHFIGSNERAIWETIVPDDETLRQKLLLAYREYRAVHDTPYEKLVDPQVGELFHKLKELGIKIGIASSSDSNAIHKLMDTARVAELVDFTLSGEDCSAHKPDPEIYLRSVKALGLGAAEVLAVEDSPTGIAAAKSAGICVYALRPRHGEDLDQSAADGVIEKLMDILNYL